MMGGAIPSTRKSWGQGYKPSTDTSCRGQIDSPTISSCSLTGTWSPSSYYEVEAHRQPDQSVQRAVKCRNALRAKNPDVRLSAVVIAESFSLKERDIANQSAVECLRANVSVDLEVELHARGLCARPHCRGEARREVEEKTPQE